MKIKDIDMYKDGGTWRFVTDEGTFYLDKRLKTDTKYQLYDNYPDRGNIIENSEPIKIKLHMALEDYHHNFYSPSTIKCVREDLLIHDSL